MKKAHDRSLSIQNLHAGVEGKEILKGVTLTVKPGQIHAIMGPNGSGKSTMAQTLMGHAQCQISNVAPSPKRLLRVGDKCQMKIGRTDLMKLSPEERAKAGLFLAFQSPVAIPGVSAMNLLRSAFQNIHGAAHGKLEADTVQNSVLARRWQSSTIDLTEFTSTVKECAHFLHLDELFLSRGIHDGFSGGEKKKLEMLQALVLRPKFAIFDEIDTGLDVDALKLVALGIKRLVKEGTGVIVITHYQRILKYVKPDVVHVFVGGRIVTSGPAKLAKTIEKEGYERYL